MQQCSKFRQDLVIQMKIAFAYDLPFPWHIGGIEKIMDEESRELAKRNEVHFFTLRWPGMEKDFVKDRVHYHAYFSSSIDTAYRHGRRSIRKAMLFAFSMLHLFRYRFDVLIIDQFPYLHIPVAWLFCRLTGCKLVIKVAEVWHKDYWKKYTNVLVGSAAYVFSKYWVKRADFYITNSVATRNRFEAFANKYGLSIAFSPVLDNEKIQKALEKKDAAEGASVIFVGRLIKEKRIDKWIEMVAAARSIDPSINGAIIGEGVEKHRIEDMIKSKGLEGIISMPGRIESTEKLYKTIAASKLMLNMSEREGLSITTLESLSLGTPVLLPSYTPIPSEVKGMCVVEDEANIPRKIVEICKSADKKAYLHNLGSLKGYYTADILKYYGIVFEKLGVSDEKYST